MSKTLKRLICLVNGHRWEFRYNHQGGELIGRICLRCGNRETFTTFQPINWEETINYINMRREYPGGTRISDNE